MKCYPEMNVKIVDILRLSDNLSMLYGAQRIEDLERILDELVEKRKQTMVKPKRRSK